MSLITKPAPQTRNPCADITALHALHTAIATRRCFAFWGVSSSLHSLNGAGAKSRWQERVGGSSGYSTTCVGASTSGSPSGAIPGAFQVGCTVEGSPELPSLEPSSMQFTYVLLVSTLVSSSPPSLLHK